jgi:hypothetical protein
MFTIELLIMRGMNSDNPAIVDRVVSERTRLDYAERTAKSLLAKASLRFRANPPDAYRILDHKGFVVLRSWEKPL